MICMSDAMAYLANTFIGDLHGERIGCKDKMKALGMYFLNRPDMQAHVQAMSKRFRQMYWTLRNLKNSGFTEEELVRVYTTMLSLRKK